MAVHCIFNHNSQQCMLMHDALIGYSRQVSVVPKATANEDKRVQRFALLINNIDHLL